MGKNITPTVHLRFIELFISANRISRLTAHWKHMLYNLVRRGVGYSKMGALIIVQLGLPYIDANNHVLTVLS